MLAVLIKTLLGRVFIFSAMLCLFFACSAAHAAVPVAKAAFQDQSSALEPTLQTGAGESSYFLQLNARLPDFVSSDYKPLSQDLLPESLRLGKPYPLPYFDSLGITAAAEDKERTLPFFILQGGATAGDVVTPDRPYFLNSSENTALYLPARFGKLGWSLTLNTLPTNGTALNLNALYLRAFLLQHALISSVGTTGFGKQLSNFDRHVYASFAGRMVRAQDSFSQLGKGCSLKAQQNCGLYFTGKAVRVLLSESGKDSPFYIKPGLYGIPLSFDLGFRPQLRLRAALSSDAPFVNYGSLNELELAVLADLGYKLNPRAVIGHSVFSFGSAGKKRVEQLALNFAAQEASGEYGRSPALAPMSVGLHVYGSYNDLTVTGTLLSAGQGSVGIRVDGSANRLILPYRSLIIADGKDSSALLIANGRDNVISVGGRLQAAGAGGSAIKASFGSNIYSDLSGTMYSLSGQQAGAMLEKLNVSGMLEGREQSIFVDQGSFIREINLCAQARLDGGIRVLWNPRLLEIAGKTYLQLSEPDRTAGLAGSKLELAAAADTENLRSVLNLGLLPAAAAAAGASAHVGDARAQIMIDGAIEGPGLQINQLGGRSFIKGGLDAHALRIGKAVLRLDLPENQPGRLNELYLEQGAVLDLANGRADVLELGSAHFEPGSSVRVDCAADGSVLDSLRFNKQGADDSSGLLSLEPAVSFEQLRRLSSDPKRFLDFMSRFNFTATESLDLIDMQSSFPGYIWDNGGAYGRELICSARGCRCGAFTQDFATQQQELAPWRYYLSAGGLFALLALTYIYFALPRFKHWLSCRQGHGQKLH